MTPRSWADYHATCGEVVEAFGRTRAAADLRPVDFSKLRAQAAARLGPVALGNYVQRVRTVFKYGFDTRLLDVPVRYGQSFDRPTARAIRLARADRGARFIAAADLWKLIDAAYPQMRAMILLGVNCGFGQTDCATLTRSVLYARPGWIQYRRPKSGAGRRCPLWEETSEALKAAAAARPAAADPADADRVFLTPNDRP